MIDRHIFQELRALIPLEQWAVIVQELFDPQSGDVAKLIQLMSVQSGGEAIGNQAHKLKGAALLLGLVCLGNWAAHIEQLTRQTPAVMAPEVIERLRQLAADTQAEIQANLQA
ncbi:MAG: hypothetical protein RL357_416 [Pseudomonadota bacterium]|jgi:HPt (histidine-containing phosphotransfer) domain-containing protein